MSEAIMGLYDDDNAAIIEGEVDAAVYWEARTIAEMLDRALSSEQPWNAIADWLPRALATLDAALDVYPNHEDLARWKARAVGIDADIDPDYGTDWARGFPWSQQSYRRGWTALHWARFARGLASPHWERVRAEARRARSAWEKCFNIHDWPAAARQELERGLEEAEQLADEAFRELH